MRRINFLDWLYPPKCMVCENIIDINEEKWFCGHCKDLLTYVEGAVCDKCGRPERKEGTCAECAGRRLVFERNYSVCIYDGVMKSLIHKFKYGRHPGYGRGLGMVMHRKLDSNIVRDIDFIVPVPLHRKKMKSRGYNQAELLAAELARGANKTLRANALMRIRETKPQSALSHRERANNISGAFLVRNVKEAEGKNFLLVDDIFTTGSTLSECAKVLYGAKAKSVKCVTLAVALPKED